MRDLQPGKEIPMIVVLLIVVAVLTAYAGYVYVREALH